MSFGVGAVVGFIYSMIFPGWCGLCSMLSIPQLQDRFVGEKGLLTPLSTMFAFIYWGPRRAIISISALSSLRGIYVSSLFNVFAAPFSAFMFYM